MFQRPIRVRTRWRGPSCRVRVQLNQWAYTFSPPCDGQVLQQPGQRRLAARGQRSAGVDHHDAHARAAGPAQAATSSRSDLPPPCSSAASPETQKGQSAPHRAAPQATATARCDIAATATCDRAGGLPRALPVLCPF
jgi:hypothetical protein